MASSKQPELARRLRALADRLARPDGSALSATTAEAISRALDAWERELTAEEGAPATKSPAPGGQKGGAIRIWCDGSCSPNPGAGGWGAIVERDGAREELSGSAPHSTNNVMEMTAAIEALRRTPPGAAAEVTTDSQYLKNGITRWIRGWKRNGWRKADGDPVLNQELWRELDRLAAAREVAWRWTRGHSGHPENERCDELANAARRAISP